jgi:hypothetical protein
MCSVWVRIMLQVQVFIEMFQAVNLPHDTCNCITVETVALPNRMLFVHCLVAG